MHLGLYEQEKLFSGGESFNQLQRDPERNHMSIKRLMGRGFGDQMYRNTYRSKNLNWVEISQPTARELQKQHCG